MSTIRGNLAEWFGDELLFLDPPETYDRAIVGVVERVGLGPVVCYDEERVLQALVDVEGLSHEDALEWYSVNTSGAYVGERTPVFLRRPPEEPDEAAWMAALGPCGK